MTVDSKSEDVGGVGLRLPVCPCELKPKLGLWCCELCCTAGYPAVSGGSVNMKLLKVFIILLFVVLAGNLNECTLK